MATAGAAALLFMLCSAAASLALFLPALVAAESLHNRPPAVARRFWLIVNMLPVIVGALLTALGFAFALIEGSDAHSRLGPHWCLATREGLPDVAFRFRLYLLAATGLLLFALGRLVLSWQSSRRAEQLAHRLLARQHDSSAAPLLVLQSQEADCFSLGLTRPVMLVTTGLSAVLDASEQAAVVAHEQCHVRNRDSRLELVVRAVSDPLVWVPSTHYYLHALRAAVERVCDEAAVEQQGRGPLAAALRRMAAVKRSRQLRLQGDLAPLRPTFPGYASPEARLAALEEETLPSLALPLAVMIGIQAALGALALLWGARTLHDLLYCLAVTMPKLLGG